MALHALCVASPATAIREPAPSPVEVLDALLDRIATVDRENHSWAWLDMEKAGEEAAILARAQDTVVPKPSLACEDKGLL